MSEPVTVKTLTHNEPPAGSPCRAGVLAVIREHGVAPPDVPRVVTINCPWCRSEDGDSLGGTLTIEVRSAEVGR